MNTKTILPTNNTEWGFWGTAGHSGYDQQMTWEAASNALATAFNLRPEQVRGLLDARFGRHLADDLSFIPAGREPGSNRKAHHDAPRGSRLAQVVREGGSGGTQRLILAHPFAVPARRASH